MTKVISEGFPKSANQLKVTVLMAFITIIWFLLIVFRLLMEDLKVWWEISYLDLAESLIFHNILDSSLI